MNLGSLVFPEIAGETFTVLAINLNHTKLGLQPADRALEVIKVIELMGELGGDYPLNLRDCAAGFALLAQPKSDDEPMEIAQSRLLCGEIALRCGTPEHGDVTKLAAVLYEAHDALRDSTQEDERALAQHLLREAQELDPKPASAS